MHLIGSDLASGTRQGYQFTLTGNAAGYLVNAQPVTHEFPGNKSYFSDQTMVIRQNIGSGRATATSQELGSH